MISDYIIPHRDLCGRFVTITAFGQRVMGFPVLIEDEKVGGGGKEAHERLRRHYTV